MASSITLPKFCPIGTTILKSRPCSRRLFVTARPLQATAEQHAADACNKASEALKHGNKSAQYAGEDMMNKAANTADQVAQKAKGMAKNATETAQDLTNKATQTAKEAWESAKNTTEKVKDTVVGKGQEAKECAKEKTESVKRAINTKT